MQKILKTVTAITSIALMNLSLHASKDENACDECEEWDETEQRCVPSQNGMPCNDGFCCEGECLPVSAPPPDCEPPDNDYSTQFGTFKITRDTYGKLTTSPYVIVTILKHKIDYKFKIDACNHTVPICGTSPQPSSIVVSEDKHTIEVNVSIDIPKLPLSIDFKYIKEFESINFTYEIFPPKEVPKCERQQGAWAYLLVNKRTHFAGETYKENYRRIWFRDRNKILRNVTIKDTPFITNVELPIPKPELSDWTGYKKAGAKKGNITRSICL